MHSLPAWLVAPTGPARSTWVVEVHGRAAPRAEALRVLPTLAAAGLPTLVVTYRNDEEAPRSPSGCYHLGDTEWRDVTAAIRYAVTAGAQDVVLYGWSMGGAIVLNLLRRAAPAEVDAVRGVILDCPVIDWTETFAMHARALRVPRPWTWTTMRLIERRIGVRLAELDHRRHVPGLPAVPILAFVDHDDATVAPAPTVSWAGLFNSYYWLDPARRVAGVILTQILPFADPTVVRLYGQFERGVYTLAEAD